MKILNFGSCNIDLVYNVSHIVTPGETISSLNLFKTAGGKGLNQSVAIARSGSTVFHAGCIGQDGEMLKETLKISGVNVDYLKTVNSPTGHAIIQVESTGENSIIVHHGANFEVTKEFIDSVLVNFNKNDILLLQNEISNVNYIIEKAFEIGMTVVFNPSPIDQTIKQIDLNKVSVLILNEIEAFNITGQKGQEQIIKYFKENFKNLKVILTLGSKGSVYFDKENTVFQAAQKANVVDTTGAGDTFTGYLVSELANGVSPQEMLKTPSLAAGLAVYKKGAAVSIPTKSEVLDKINAN